MEKLEKLVETDMEYQKFIKDNNYQTYAGRVLKDNPAEYTRS